VQDYRERVEQNLQDKVEEMLTTVLGPGRATVKVHAVIDTNSISTVTEKYDPKGVAIKEESTTGEETGAGNASGEGQPAASGSKKKDETIVTEYQVGKTVTQQVVLPGEIKSLSVAAIVDLWPADVNEAETSEQPAQIMDPNDVAELIENALGLDLNGRDSLKVVPVRIPRQQEQLLEEEPSGGLDFIAIARQASLGIMAICALLVFRMFRGAKKKAQAETAAQPVVKAEETMGLLPEHAGVSPVAFRKQIASALEKNPERVRQLFTQWIEE
jgi:flagellar M-ring protein FliF